MRIAETERLIFRELTLSDAEELFRSYSQAETMRFMGSGPVSVEEVRLSIQNHIDNYYKKYGFGLWAVVLKENNSFIGRCGLLYQKIEGVRDLELSYLLDNDYWGRGLATEAALASARLGFERYGFVRVIAVINPQNTASVRVAEKVGLKFEREIASFKDFGRVSLYALDRGRPVKAVL